MGETMKINFRTAGGSSLLPHLQSSPTLMDVLQNGGLHFYSLPFPPRRPPLGEWRRILGGHCTCLQEDPIGEVCVGRPGPSITCIPEVTIGPPVSDTCLHGKRFIFIYLEYTLACFSISILIFRYTQLYCFCTWFLYVHFTCIFAYILFII